MTPADRSSPPKQDSLRLRRWMGGRHYELLLLSLLAFVIVHPLFVTYEQVFTLAVFLSLVLAAALFVASSSRNSIVIGLVIGLPFIGTMWAYTFTPAPPFTVFGNVSGMVFFIFVMSLMLRDVAGTGRVTRDTLYGAACVYLLIGITFSFAYGLIDYFNREAFEKGTTVLMPDGRIASFELLYFSYVTLTTLGYGDISPLSPLARALAAVEAMTGVLYTALLVARLVGMYAGAEKGSPR